LQLDITRKVLLCQARAPQQIDHGPREMLKRFPDDFAPLTGRESIAKRSLQIAQGDLMPMPIKEVK
jgi:hypothetical protein